LVAAVRAAPLTRVALGQREAAAALGVCLNTFRSRIAPDLPVVYIGRRKLYSVRDLEDWFQRTKAKPLEGLG
jgi:hypothetical protein